MNTTAQAKQALKKSLKQLRDEPLEVLRSAAKQVTGVENLPNLDQQQDQDEKSKNDEVPKEELEYKKRQSEQDGRHLQALESELKDIRRQKLFNDLMKRIQEGEDVPIEEFSELSFEQKDVLKAQLEASRKQQAMQQNQSANLPEPAAKRGRQMGGGQKGAAKRETTRVEKPVPPSG